MRDSAFELIGLCSDDGLGTGVRARPRYTVCNMSAMLQLSVFVATRCLCFYYSVVFSVWCVLLISCLFTLLRVLRETSLCPVTTLFLKQAMRISLIMWRICNVCYIMNTLMNTVEQSRVNFSKSYRRIFDANVETANSLNLCALIENSIDSIMMK